MQEALMLLRCLKPPTRPIPGPLCSLACQTGLHAGDNSSATAQSKQVAQASLIQAESHSVHKSIRASGKTLGLKEFGIVGNVM